MYIYIYLVIHLINDLANLGFAVQEPDQIRNIFTRFGDSPIGKESRVSKTRKLTPVKTCQHMSRPWPLRISNLEIDG